LRKRGLERGGSWVIAIKKKKTSKVRKKPHLYAPRKKRPGGLAGERGNQGEKVSPEATKRAVPGIIWVRQKGN